MNGWCMFGERRQTTRKEQKADRDQGKAGSWGPKTDN
jgi:hypothetical protein